MKEYEILKRVEKATEEITGAFSLMADIVKENTNPNMPDSLTKVHSKLAHLEKDLMEVESDIQYLIRNRKQQALRYLASLQVPGYHDLMENGREIYNYKKELWKKVNTFVKELIKNNVKLVVASIPDGFYTLNQIIYCVDLDKDKSILLSDSDIDKILSYAEEVKAGDKYKNLNRKIL